MRTVVSYSISWMNIIMKKKFLLLLDIAAY